MTDELQASETAGPESPAGCSPPRQAEVVADVGEPEPGDASAPTADLQADIAALNDRMLRLQADFDNFRKRTQRERAELQQRGAERVLADLLPVLDHFEMGLAAARSHDAPEAVLGGLDMVLAQFRDVLARHGVEAVEAEGRPFDPHCHEAVGHEPSSAVPADTVLRETRRGYRVGGRLLRAAEVIVSSGPLAENADGG